MSFDFLGICPICNESYAGIESSCRTCNNWRGYPNVILASHPDEQAALDQRYQRSASTAASRNAAGPFQDFQTEVKHSKAVLNCSIEFALWFFSREDVLYASYYEQLVDGIRQPARVEYDRHRAAADAILYGTHAREIIFAALSLDGKGLVSYGPVSMQLRDVAIAFRATVLEENLYAFIARHGLVAGMPLPNGYIATWSRRDVLASVKIEPWLDVHTTLDAFPALLLTSTGNRPDDCYLEVHIYGPFNHRAVERVLAPKSGRRPQDRALLGAAKELAKAKGVIWEEV